MSSSWCFLSMAKKKYFWITIDGTDGVGKTTVSQSLADLFRVRFKNKIDVVCLPEFSQTVVGDLLRKLVSKYQFVQLEKGKHYVGAETSLLLGDLFAKTEACDRFSKNTIVISDRGLCSLIAYQQYRYDKTQNSINDKKGFYEWLESLRSLCIRSDLTFLLTLPVKEIIKRLRNRGDAINSDLIELITHTQESMKTSKGTISIIDCMNKENDSICLEILNVVEPQLSKWAKLASQV